MPRHSFVLAILAALPFLLANGKCTPASPDWFVLAGQSNMVGWSDQTTPLAYGESYREVGEAVEKQTPVIDPLVFYSADEAFATNQSAWPEFARYHRERTGRWPRFIATAVPASCLSPTLPKGGIIKGNWDPDTGELYARTLQVWQAAGSPRLRAFLWLQGECESAFWRGRAEQEGRDEAWQYEQSYADYYALLTNLADRVAADFDTVLIAAPISLMWCRWEADCWFMAAERWERRGVHDAIIMAAADHPNILLGPFSDDLRAMPDWVHTWDVNTLGVRWASAIP